MRIGRTWMDVTAANLDEAREACSAVDQRDELVPGAETWGIAYEPGGQRGQMTRLPNGRGAIELGGSSEWGDWVGGLLVLDCGARYTEDGEEVGA